MHSLNLPESYFDLVDEPKKTSEKTKEISELELLDVHSEYQDTLQNKNEPSIIGKKCKTIFSKQIHRF